MNKPHAPVALFTYNRPDHTLKTLESLSKNKLAQDTVLYVFCDGPKKDATPEERKKISEVRKIVKSKKWCRKVTVFEEPVNKGLADSIIDGVTKVVKKHGNIIVLEDDIVTSPGFLQYMNDALEKYKDEARVMHISGYQYPIQRSLPEAFFFTHISSWGWATWERAWNLLETNPKKLLHKVEELGELHDFDLKGAYKFSDQLHRNIDGSLYTWAIKWLSTVFLSNGLVLYPGKSLVVNIGFDDTGMNSGNETTYIVKRAATSIKIPEMKLEVNRPATREIILFFRKREVTMDGRGFKNLRKLQHELINRLWFGRWQRL